MIWRLLERLGLWRKRTREGDHDVRIWIYSRFRSKDNPIDDIERKKKKP